jgi:hypothetical protein
MGCGGMELQAFGLEVLLYIGWLHLREVKFQRERDGS